ncbi:MAG: carbohydrate ABC transporter permease [Candidatus Methylomirabilota bacterium]|jgi:multiple sugar transport system permease protein
MSGTKLMKRIALFNIPLGVAMILLLFPFYWMLITSFKPDPELYDVRLDPLLIQHPTLAQIRQLLSQTHYLRWLYNTMFIAVFSTLISLAASLLAAYGIQRLQFRGSGSLGVAIFLSYLVPPTILFIPLAHIIFSLRLWDTPWSLILTYPTFLIPFCTWLLMGYFKTFPKELEECAMIDGATRIGVLIRIVVPLSIPGILSCGIFSFTLSWNEYLYALVFLSDTLQKTVPVGVTTELVRGDVYSWGPLMAGALLGSVPVALVYSFFVEYYVTGLTGALKE